ncbi:MAG: diguanylate cyclase, partial [bacterium]|nr:diguanylate cyclase [bacterium]
ITGLSREDLLDTDFTGYFTDVQKARQGNQWLFNEGSLRDYVLEIKHKDNTITPVLYNASVYWDTEGKIMGAIAIIRDITQLKQAEKALRESENKFRVLAETTSSIFFIHKDGQILYVNPAGLALTEYSEEELQRMKIWEIIHPDHKKIVMERAAARARGDHALEHYEMKIVSRSGKVYWLDLRAAPIEFNNQRCIIGTCFDITERKKVEEELQIEHQQLLSIFDSIDEVIYVTDPVTYEVLYLNQAAKKTVGDIIGQKCYKGLQNLDSPCPFCTNQHIFGDNLGKSYVWEFQNKVTQQWYHCVDKAIRWPDGRMVRYEMAINIHERKMIDEERHQIQKDLENQVREKTSELVKLNEQLSEKQKQQKALLDSIPDMAWLKDKESRFIEVNHAFVDAAGMAAEELKGKTDYDVWPKDMADRYRSDDRIVMQTGVMKKTEEPLIDQNKRESWIEAIKVPIFNDRNEVIGIAGIARDITRWKTAEEILLKAQTELEDMIHKRTDELAKANEVLKEEVAERTKAEETIRHLAYHDALTGLPNRMLFDDRINITLASAKRNKEKAAVMFLDLDKFKDINDKLGHNIGDQLLKAVSERLVKLLRKNDTIARMGGDEFILLLTELTRDEFASEIANKILKMFQEPYTIDTNEIHITASVGIAIYPEDGTDTESLVQNADIAMYYAKEQGRNQYFRYNKNINAKA